jgi:hypothetical protein
MQQQILSDTTVDDETREQYFQLLYLTLLGFGLMKPWLYFVQCFCGKRLRRRQQVLAGQVDSDHNDDDVPFDSTAQEQRDQRDQEVPFQCNCHYGVRILQLLQLMEPVRMVSLQITNFFVSMDLD